MNVESNIIRETAKAACERVSRKVRLSLQKMKEGMQSGNDSGLKNVWDEICVQLQGEEAPLSDAYDQTVQQFVADEIKLLPGHELEAIWLQTNPGIDWACDHGEGADAAPFIEDDVIRYVMDNFLYRDASDWSNDQIRKYMGRTDLDWFEKDSSGANP